MIDTRAFTENTVVRSLLSELEHLNIRNKIFSDVIDAEGNQYVDLVQEGGGMLGIALVGYAYILEQMGIRFFSLAGTSAGAINTMLTASLGTLQEKKSEKTLYYLGNTDFSRFIDGDKDAQNFVKTMMGKKTGSFWWKAKAIFYALQIKDNMQRDTALNPGLEFFRWMAGILEDNGIKTMADLDRLRSKLPNGFRVREGIANQDISGIKPLIAIIAADITTQTKVEFPRMSGMYWAEPDKVHPAYYARASMSVPLFFFPLRINNIPRNEKTKQLWKEMAGYDHELPSEVVFVDGGVVSNFPISVFHIKQGVPRMPTFGVKLGVSRQGYTQIDSFGSMLSNTFDTARHIYDFDFIFRNKEYRKLVQHIDVGDHHWLNFNATDKMKIDLFVRGARAGAEFLKKFDWAEYKNIRASITT
jgi:NTE family protein